MTKLLNSIMASKVDPNAMYEKVMGSAGARTSSQPMFQAPSSGAGDADYWNKVLAEGMAAEQAAKQRQQNAAFMSQNPGTQFAQAPQAQAAPIQSLMQMVGQGGPQQQAGGQQYSNPYLTSLMSGV